MRKKILTIATCFVMLFLALALFTLSNRGESNSGLNQPDLAGLSIVAIGQSSPLFEEVTSQLSSYGANIEVSVGLPNSTLEGMCILFDGEWIDSRLNQTTIIDEEFKTFLIDAIPKKVSLVAIGGNTIRLFDVVRATGLSNITNPCIVSPTIAGFRLAEKDGNVVSAMLMGQGTDVIGMLLDWLGEEI
ncbi:MAG: hypothetical protein ACUVRA_00840 [Candidatus Bathyarchaeaceae archaeon]